MSSFFLNIKVINPIIIVIGHINTAIMQAILYRGFSPPSFRNVSNDTFLQIRSSVATAPK
jgi:hypothetical protein